MAEPHTQGSPMTTDKKGSKGKGKPNPTPDTGKGKPTSGTKKKK